MLESKVENIVDMMCSPALLVSYHRWSGLAHISLNIYVLFCLCQSLYRYISSMYAVADPELVRNVEMWMVIVGSRLMKK